MTTISQLVESVLKVDMDMVNSLVFNNGSRRTGELAATDHGTLLAKGGAEGKTAGAGNIPMINQSQGTSLS